MATAKNTSLELTDREFASNLNPFISDSLAEISLTQCADAINMLGLMISADPGGIDLSPLSRVMETIASAMMWESDYLCRTRSEA